MKTYGSNTRYVSSGISLPTLLTVLFVVLKLVGVIDWSWWWVFAPTWITVGVCILVLFLLCIIVVFAQMR